MANRFATALGWAGWPVLLIALAMQFLVPSMEERFLPIRTRQSVHDVIRTGDRLCWLWTSVKERPRTSDNLDAFLESGTDRFVTTVFKPESGEPWNRGQALPPSPVPQDQHWCTLLPPSTAGKALRLIQVAYYPSALLPWLHVTVRVPDVASP